MKKKVLPWNKERFLKQRRNEISRKKWSLPYSGQPHAQYVLNSPQNSQRIFYVSTYKLHGRQPDHADKVDVNTFIVSCNREFIFQQDKTKTQFTEYKCGKHKKQNSEVQKQKLQNKSCFRPVQSRCAISRSYKKYHTSHLDVHLMKLIWYEDMFHGEINETNLVLQILMYFSINLVKVRYV